MIDKTIPLEEIQIRIRSIEEDVRTLKRVIENAFLCISSFNSYAYHHSIPMLLGG